MVIGQLWICSMVGCIALSAFKASPSSGRHFPLLSIVVCSGSCLQSVCCIRRGLGMKCPFFFCLLFEHTAFNISFHGGICWRPCSPSSMCPCSAGCSASGPPQCNAWWWHPNKNEPLGFTECSLTWSFSCWGKWVKYSTFSLEPWPQIQMEGKELHQFLLDLSLVNGHDGWGTGDGRSPCPQAVLLWASWGKWFLLVLH